MSIVLLLLMVGALYAAEYFRRGGERLMPGTASVGTDFSKLPLPTQLFRPAGLERRHSERRHTNRRDQDRRYAA